MRKTLSSYTTCELVAELEKREAVEKITAEPHASFEIAVDNYKIASIGPAVILHVWD